MKNIISVFAIFILLFFNLSSSLNAQDNSIPYEKINPDRPVNYSIKRLREKMSLLLTFSKTKKVTIYSIHLNRRLAELKYTVDNQDIGNIQAASQRYFTTAGKLTEYINNNQLDNKKEETKQLLESHKKKIEPLLTVFDSTTAQWRFVKYDYDYLNQYLAQLN